MVAVGTTDDGPAAGLSLLSPEEEALIEGAAEGRQRKFRAARGCARRALVRLGVPPVPVLRGRHGEPRWPAGIVGSLTHCPGYQAAAVARAGEVAALGVDAEPNRPMRRAGMLELVTVAEERARLRELARLRDDVSWDRLLFSAKESAYKAWYPLTGRRPGPAGIVIEVGIAGRFEARMEGTGTALEGWWLARGEFLLTGAMLRAAAPNKRRTA
ncbi:hypothetical protein GCM10010218_23770 [Streptomyces mashuensis]|uniref:4'-phosphopantetheinyl transferase n=1 Tax=Streptomyces mashuensis TaxID=33904 RepID=A0A919ECT0_9ACTN|nr:hypothetical protein GCM10010218_23770 [Streptomyces mashuensis]